MQFSVVLVVELVLVGDVP